MTVTPVGASRAATVMSWPVRKAGDFLLALIGIDRYQVNSVPERAFYISAALATLIYGGYASVAGATVMSTATHTGTIRWLPVALGFAVMVMLFDRVVISHVRADFDKTSQDTDHLRPVGFKFFVTRFLIAFLLAFVVTDSLGPVLFRSEIDDYLATSRVDTERRLTEERNFKAQAEWDGVTNDLQRQLADAKDDTKKKKDDVTAEERGGGITGDAGQGPEYNRLNKIYQDALAAQNALQAQVNTRPAQPDFAALPPVVVPDFEGLIDQEHALWSVLFDRPMGLVKYLGLSLLLIAVDLTIVIMKFMAKGNLYERTVARSTLVFYEESAEPLRALEHDRVRLVVDSRSRGIRAHLNAQEIAIERQLAKHQIKLARHRARYNQQLLALGLPPLPAKQDDGGVGPNGTRPAPPPGGGSDTPAKAPQPGDILDYRWEIVGPLPSGERGNLAEVWLGRDLKGRYGNVVVKAVMADDSDSARPYIEMAWAEMAVRSRNQYVAQVLARSEREDRVLWTVTPYYSGGDLHRYYERRPLRPLRQVLAVVDHVLEALDDVGKRFHGDIKPGNLVVEDVDTRSRKGLPDLKDLHIRVIDWGQSRLWNLLGNQVDIKPSGTEMWRSPEQRTDAQRSGTQVDSRSDLYSVGVLLYWAISGHLPFEAEFAPGDFTEGRVEDLQKQGRAPEPLHNLIPGVPPSVGKLTNRLLSYRPEDRMPGVSKVSRVVHETRDLLGDIYREVETRALASGTDLHVGPGAFPGNA